MAKLQNKVGNVAEDATLRGKRGRFMRIAWMIFIASTFIAAPVVPVSAQSSAAPATENAAPPKGVSAPSKQDSKDHPSANQGTPAVVVDDNEVESLLGRDVKSASGEKLGQITDVIVDKMGNVRAAVIDFGGFLGVGSRKVAVAWGALKFSPASIVVDMTRDELRVTPEYRTGEPIVIVGSQPPPKSASPPPADKPPATK
jgi:sporulation protein YlmC with PRC-barrel domain